MQKNKLEALIANANSAFHPSRELFEGTALLHALWANAVESGQLEGTPEQVQKARERAQLDQETAKLCISALNPQSN